MKRRRARDRETRVEFSKRIFHFNRVKVHGKRHNRPSRSTMSIQNECTVQTIGARGVKTKIVLIMILITPEIAVSNVD